MKRLYLLVAVLLVAALLGGMALYVFVNRPGRTAGDLFAPCRASAVAGGMGSIGGAFTLVREDGVTVTDRDVLTKPSLVYFGYTYCPDVCPLDSARNAEALDILQGQGLDAQAVFISIDPERDTPEVVREFTDGFHKDMIGLTGSPEQVRVASRAYKTFYQKNGDDPEDYLMDHTTFTYLVLPGRGVVEFYRRDMSAEEVARSAACFISRAR